MKKRPGLADTAYRLLAEGRVTDLEKRFASRLYGSSTSYGLRRDLDLPFATPTAKIPIFVRRLLETDIPCLLPDKSGNSATSWEIRVRRAHLESEIPQCYVAVDQRTDTPCYFQWLMAAAHNSEIQAFFHGSFPVLMPNEALLENAYTPVQYRGMGIMSAAMAQITEQALKIGARYVITFVDQHNVSSLKGCRKAGFSPYIERRETRVFFQTHRTFEPLPEGFLMPYERQQRAYANPSPSSH